eukprot:7897405-Pyramimonas_sp.AAC.1
MDGAAANVSGHDNSTLPLDSFRRSTPPGWVTGIKRYPIRRYAQLLNFGGSRHCLLYTSPSPRDRSLS